MYWIIQSEMNSHEKEKHFCPWYYWEFTGVEWVPVTLRFLVDILYNIDSALCPKEGHWSVPALPHKRLSLFCSVQLELGLAVVFAVEGRVTRCSSIRLAWERMMRLKKSSSGTVGPRMGGGGGAQRWSSKRDPCKIDIKHSILWFHGFYSDMLRLICRNAYSVSFKHIRHLALDKHVKEIIVRLGAVSVGHQVAEHGLVTALIKPQAGQTPPCGGRLLHPSTLTRDIGRVWHGWERIKSGTRKTVRFTMEIKWQVKS